MSWDGLNKLSPSQLQQKPVSEAIQMLGSSLSAVACNQEG